MCSLAGRIVWAAVPLRISTDSRFEVEGQGVENDPKTVSTDDSPYARSPRRQIGYGFSIDIFGGDKDKKGGDDPSQIAIDDPEYAEYLEGRAGRNSRLQEWKAQQAGAEPRPDLLLTLDVAPAAKNAGLQDQSFFFMPASNSLTPDLQFCLLLFALSTLTWVSGTS